MDAKSRTLAALISGTAVSCVLSLPAFAQQTTTSTGSEEASISEVVVTGSRIQRNGYETPTPVTVVGAQELRERAPTSIPDALNQLPQLQGSQSPAQKNNLSVNTTPAAGNFLNLRNLGTNRLLVMLDGVRLPPTAATGQVSVDTLPDGLVQRVDIVTGGASAVYGSDAISGVVNYILDRNFTGLKLNAQSGISKYGDNFSYRLGGAGGLAMMNEKLRVLGSAEYRVEKGIEHFSDRPSGAGNYCDAGGGTAARPSELASNCLARSATYGGNIVGGAMAGLAFGPDGTLHTFNTGAPNTGTGGEGSLYLPSQTLITPSHTWQGFGQVSYDFSDSLRFRVNGIYGDSKQGPHQAVHANINANTSTTAPILSGNAFLQPSVQALMDQRGVTIFNMTRWPDPSLLPAGKYDLPMPTTVQRTRNATFISGLSGTVAERFNWDANYVHGWSKFNSDTHEVEHPKFIAALDAVRDPTGNIVCRVTLTNPGLYPGCVPINLMGHGAPTAAAVDYVRGHSRYSIINKMDIFSANLGGDAFDLWAGPVSFNMGAEYRTQSLDQVSNGDPANVIDKTGLRGAPAVLNRFNVVNVGGAVGQVKVKEAYGELAIPLARDLPFAQSLELSLAGRVTDYSTSGRVYTWKIGGDYSPIADLRIRGTLSRDIRAPSLYELFAGVARSQASTFDIHTGLTQVTTQESSGNRGLTPEIGKTKLIGFVYQPSWLTGLGVSVDYYDIAISDAIASQGGQSAIQACEDTGGTGPICALVIRPRPFSDRSPLNFPQQILSSPINIAKITRQGMDFELSYRFSADRLVSSWGGNFDLRGLASNTQVVRQDNGLGAPPTQTAGYNNNPRWRGSISAAYRADRFSIFVQERFTGKFNTNASNLTQLVYKDDSNIAPNFAYTDVTLTYRALENKNAEVFLSIANLFNKEPPVTIGPVGGQDRTNVLYPVNRTFYDVIGRYFTAGVRLRL